MLQFGSMTRPGMRRSAATSFDIDASGAATPPVGRQPAPPLARRYVRDTQVFRTVRCHRQEAGGRRTVASRIFDRLVNTHANLDTATVASWWRRRRSSPPRLPPRRWLPRARRGSPRLRHAPSMGETGAFLVESVHRGSSDSVGRHVANWIAACDYLRR